MATPAENVRQQFTLDQLLAERDRRTQASDPQLEASTESPFALDDLLAERERRNKEATPQAGFNPNEIIARILGAPVDAVTAALNVAGLDIQDPVGGSASFQRGIEALPTVASALVAEPVAGVAGLARTALPGEPGVGAETIETVRQALTIPPISEAGQAGLENIGAFIEAGVDVANFPISGLVGLTELVAGQGLEQAVQTVKTIQSEGVSKTVGQRAFEETGSPLIATIAETVPEATLLALGVKKTPRGTPDITPQRAREIEEIITSSNAKGVDVLTSDIFKPKTIFTGLLQQFNERVPVFGTGGKRSAQQEQRISAMEELNASIPRVESSEIFESLQRTTSKRKKAAGQRINTVAETMNQQGVVPVENTLTSIDKAIADLSKPGKIPNQQLINSLNELKEIAPQAGDSFSTLRSFRTDARTISEAVDPAGRSQLRSSDKALFDNVLKGITDDLDAFVLQNSDRRGLTRYKEADQVYAQEARKLTKSRLKTVLDKGDIKPELINNLLFSSSPSEVKLLFNNLDTSGRQNARMALYRRALDKTISGDQINPQKFISELNKLSDNFGVFFRGDAKAEVNGLKRLLETTQRAQAAGSVTPTGQSLIPFIGGGISTAAVAGNLAAQLAVLTATTSGVAARVYESSGVRNALIALGKSEKRSTLELDILQSLPAFFAEANAILQQEERAGDRAEGQTVGRLVIE